jgi:WD40 repeat protein
MDIHNLLATMNGNTIELWSATTYDLVRSTTRITDTHFNSATFSPDNMKLATDLHESLIIIWDVETLTEVATLEAAAGQYSRVHFNQSGDKLISCHNQKRLNYWSCSMTVWSMDTYVALKTVVNMRTSPIAAFEICCSSLVVTKEKNQLLFWDYDTDEKSDATFADEIVRTMSARSAFDGEIAIGFRSGRIIVWNSEIQKLVVELPFSGSNRDASHALCFDRQGSRLFATTVGNKIKCWDLASGSIILLIETSSNMYFLDVAVSPDGRTVAVDGGNAMLVYDTSTGQMLTQKSKTSGWCFSIAQQTVLM